MTFPKTKRSSALSLSSRVSVVSGRTGLSTRKDRIRRAVAFVKASHATFLFSIPHRRIKAENAVSQPIRSRRMLHLGFFNLSRIAKKNTQPKHPLTILQSARFRLMIIQSGKIHPLSNYTPVCHTCGLPLCLVNPPYHPCPHPPCRTSLLSSNPDPFRVQLQPLIARVDAEIKDQLKKEEDERILAVEELRMREGAFPMLRASPSPSPSPAPGSQPSHIRSGGGPVANHPQNQGYTVMSLTAGKGGKRSQITVSSFRPGNISKSSSSSSLKKDAEDDGVARIRCPPAQVEPIRPFDPPRV